MTIKMVSAENDKMTAYSWEMARRLTCYDLHLLSKTINQTSTKGLHLFRPYGRWFESIFRSKLPRNEFHDHKSP